MCRNTRGPAKIATIVVSRILYLYLTKTKMMVVNSKKGTRNIFAFNITPIEIVKEYKYVGTIFSSNTQHIFKTNSCHLIEKACRANRSHQIALSKFRISSHNLRIETEHYETNPKLESHERLCIYCDRQSRKRKTFLT